MNDNVVSAAGTVTDATHQPNPNEAAPDPTPSQPTPEATPERPEWLPEKFKTPQDLAASYKELEAKIATKTEDIKTSLLEEISQKEGVPDEPGNYQVPEGFDAETTTSTDLWETFTHWAHERQLPQDDFNELVTFYASATATNPEAERAKLGEQAQERLDALSRWVGANVPQDQREKVINFAQTAEAVEVMETLMKLTVPQKLPGQSQEIVEEAPTEQTVQELMTSPSYLDPINRDPAVVKKVDDFFRAKYSSAG